MIVLRERIKKEAASYEGSTGLPFASPEVAEKNQKDFNDCLRRLPNASGIYRYELRGNNVISYDEVHNEFHASTDLGGYSPGSLSSKKKLTPQEEGELYHDVGLGLVDIWQVPAGGHQMASKRLWHGVVNIAPRRK